MADALKPGSPEDRVARLLLERYPIRESEIAVALAMRPGEVALAVKRLAARGLVVVEQPGGAGEEKWIALSGAGFRLMGSTSKERRDAREERKAGRPPPRDEHDPAFL